MPLSRPFMKAPRPLVAALSFSLLASSSVFAAPPTPSKGKTPAATPATATAPAPETKQTELPPVVAVVEGEEIKKEELEKTFGGFLQARQMTPEALPPGEKARGYWMILEEMIKEKLVEQRSSAIKVTDEEVTETFKKFTAKMGSEEDIQKQIAASGQTMDKVREDIRNSMRQDRWLEQEMTKSGGVTDQDAESFYKKNTDKFVTPPQVRASHILIKVAPDAKPETVLEKEKAAKAVSDRVKKGEDFAKLAQELSEDPSAKENSGDLNFFAKEQMVPEFSEVAFAMKKGDISEPVRSQFGYHVIKVTDRKDSETVALEKIKPRIVDHLKQRKADEMKRELRAKADVKVHLLEPPESAPEAAPVAP